MLIVFESIDGGGKGRQREEVLKEMNNQYPEKKIQGMEFPDKVSSFSIYNSFIHDVLHEKIEVNEDAVFLAWLFEKVLHRDTLQKAKGSTEFHLICDGYYTTTLVYQCLLDQSINLQKALEMAEFFEVPPADLNIFFDVRIDIAQERKEAEGGHDEGFDRYEGDVTKQEKIRKSFEKLVEENIFGQWEVVDGNGTVKEVRDFALQKIQKVL